MKKILVTKAFKYSPDGNMVVLIESGEQEVSEDCAAVAVEQLKVATLVSEGKQDAKSGKGKKAPAS